MDVFTMVVIIVVVSCGAGVLNNYIKSQRERDDVEVSDDVYAELETLRERVEVLEKIVTDDKYQLGRQLDELERQA